MYMHVLPACIFFSVHRVWGDYGGWMRVLSTLGTGITGSSSFSYHLGAGN